MKKEEELKGEWLGQWYSPISIHTCMLLSIHSPPIHSFYSLSFTTRDTNLNLNLNLNLNSNSNLNSYLKNQVSHIGFFPSMNPAVGRAEVGALEETALDRVPPVAAFVSEEGGAVYFPWAWPPVWGEGEEERRRKEESSVNKRRRGRVGDLSLLFSSCSSFSV